MAKPYNKISANPVFDIDSIIYLVNRLASTVTENAKQFDFWQLYYVKSGSLTIEQGGVPIIVPCGYARIFSPSKEKRITKNGADTEADFFVVSFESASPSLKLLCDRLISVSSEEAEIISDICTTGWKILEPIKLNQSIQGLCEKESSHPAIIQYLKISLEQLLIRIYCNEEKIGALGHENIKQNRRNYEKAIINDINNYMAQNISRKLTINEIATFLGVNATTLRITYKKETGESIMKAFSKMKINAAENMIATTDMNFTEISDALGFLSIYHFSRFFKKHMGITLSEYSKSFPKMKS